MAPLGDLERKTLTNDSVPLRGSSWSQQLSYPSDDCTKASETLAVDGQLIHLHIFIDSQWILAFRIPRSEPVRLCKKPLKWLKYLACCILGTWRGRLFRGSTEDFDAAKELDLSNTQFSTAGDATDSDAVREHLFFKPEGLSLPYMIPCSLIPPRSTGKIRMADLRSKHPKFSADSSTQPSWETQLRERDGGRCIFTDWTAQAVTKLCHLIPHSKGDEVCNPFSQLRCS